MVIRFFAPFEELAEREVRIELEEAISTQELVTMLASRYPGFARYSAAREYGELSAHIMFIRNGAPLKLTDRIENTDHISVLVPVTGG